MQTHKTNLPDVLVIQPRIFKDARGLFFESFQSERYQEHGMHLPFVQDNISRSEKNVVRGLHYQLERPQGKLILVTFGSIMDVIVDIRKNSKTFGKSITVELNDQNGLQVYIPPGFAHGFECLSERADVLYKCTDYYDPKDEFGVLWNDPALNIAWQTSHANLSPKDQEYRQLKDIPLAELPE
jgi:dTDP-4-dehydrorhamnose 3,5-epimerase